MKSQIRNLIAEALWHTKAYSLPAVCERAGHFRRLSLTGVLFSTPQPRPQDIGHVQSVGDGYRADRCGFDARKQNAVA